MKHIPVLFDLQEKNTKGKEDEEGGEDKGIAFIQLKKPSANEIGDERSNAAHEVDDGV